MVTVRRMKRAALPWAVALLALAVPFAAPAAKVSAVVRAPRPQQGEWFGVYLLHKKVGYLFSELHRVEGHPNQFVSHTRLVFRARVGGQKTERIHEETRAYRAEPHGRLLSFEIEDRGDGGNQTLRGRCTPEGMTVVRSRPGDPTQTLHLPPSKETVEQADPARVAWRTHRTVQGETTDASDLQSYSVTTTVAPDETRVMGGVRVRLHKFVTLSAKDHIPVETYLTSKGAIVEMDFGTQMRARAEPEEVAKKLDQVEVFGLTRVVLPKAPPAGIRKVPGQLELTVTGLPKRFQKDGFRQTFTDLPGGKVRVTLRAVPPDPSKVKSLPLRAPALSRYLESTLAVESSDPEIRATAKRIVGHEKNAYRAAKKIITWVDRHMRKDYGTSADRATDVLKQMKGDCTEHALLSEALLRASGIPARRVDGLVYVMNPDGVPALYWHEWVAAWVGEWTQLDPTFGEPVVDATHFALGHEGNATITPLFGQLRVLAVQ